jgi:dipeptidyl aminopeptidase/acylaminoacyl peptidase
MTTDRRSAQVLPDRLADLAVGPYPDYVDDVLAITARTRRRPAWMFPSRWTPSVARLADQRLRFPLRSLLVLLAILLASVVLGIVYMGSRPRVPPPFGIAVPGALVFERDGDLYVRDTVDAAPRRVMASAAIELRPTFSRQGDRVLFMRSTDTAAPEPWVAAELWVMGVDGSDPVRLADAYTVDRAEWSPDASKILLGIRAPEQDLDSAEGRVVIARTDGSGAELLDLGNDVESPTWRPGHPGQLVVAAEGIDGTALLLVNEDGSGPKSLVGPYDRKLWSTYEPAVGWSSDGTRMAYHTFDSAGRIRIHIAKVDPTGTVLSDRALSFYPAADAEVHPKWLPTDDRLVFARVTGNQYSLVVASVDGTEPPMTMTTPATNWSEIAYEIAPDGASVIVLFRNTRTAYRWELATGVPTREDLGPDDVASYQRLAP